MIKAITTTTTMNKERTTTDRTVWIFILRFFCDEITTRK
jgi:hypothetical protein